MSQLQKSETRLLAAPRHRSRHCDQTSAGVEKTLYSRRMCVAVASGSGGWGGANHQGRPQLVCFIFFISGAPKGPRTISYLVHAWTFPLGSPKDNFKVVLYSQQDGCFKTLRPVEGPLRPAQTPRSSQIGRSGTTAPATGLPAADKVLPLPSEVPPQPKARGGRHGFFRGWRTGGQGSRENARTSRRLGGLGRCLGLGNWMGESKTDSQGLKTQPECLSMFEPAACEKGEIPGRGSRMVDEVNWHWPALICEKTFKDSDRIWPDDQAHPRTICHFSTVTTFSKKELLDPAVKFF